jgi:membrane-bound ClpP family serine protease
MLPAIVVFFLCVLLLIIVASISRHKKSASRDVHLVGATALVDSELNPQGTVLVQGELWGALSRNGTSIAVHSRVHVVALRDHLLVVEPSND